MLPESVKSKGPKGLVNGFGTFKGVFTPSILTILGVVMFLRMGWVIGNVGPLGTIIIVTLASGITFLTGLSIAATATNMKVGGGGAYYMISRSLGVEAGAAVGLPLYLAQALGIAFYLSGFAESIVSLLPLCNPILVSLAALCVLGILVYTSSDLALKTQFMILSILALALISFFSSDRPAIDVAVGSIELPPPVAFWGVFAVFFPAVTGIEAGLSMSGDLKNPSRSLPWGTLSAVFCGYVIYLAIPLFAAKFADEATLRSNPLIMLDIARWRPLIVLGIWGASLSSALGALLGAPRTLQALARDRIVPSFIGAGYGGNDEPRLATAITFAVAVVAIMLGDLNAIAPVLSMFFLTSYGVLNLSAGIEGLLAAPSWRPTFRTPWLVSIIGALLCFAVMLMIDPGATIISLSLSFAVFYLMQKRRMTAYWGDMRYGILMYLAKFSVSKLAKMPINTKSWRPNLLVLSGSPSKRWYLLEIGQAVAVDSGFLTVASIIPSGSQAENRLIDTQKSIEGFLRRQHVDALVRLSVADNVASGVVSLVRDYGIGPIMPNTVILGETEQKDLFYAFAEMLIRIYQAKRNIVIIRMPNTGSSVASNLDVQVSSEGFNSKQDLTGFPKGKKVRIDVWWGRERDNASLSLVIGYMMQKNPVWQDAALSLKSITSQEERVPSYKTVLKTWLEESRLDASSEVYHQEGSKDDIFQRIRAESNDASFTLLGMQPPNLELFSENPQKAIEEYAAYYGDLIAKTNGFPPLGLVLAAEDIDFHKIFVP